jgi:hypothetical protein
MANYWLHHCNDRLLQAITGRRAASHLRSKSGEETGRDSMTDFVHIDLLDDSFLRVAMPCYYLLLLLL